MSALLGASILRCTFILILLVGGFFLSQGKSFAYTTEFRSARNVTTYGFPPYTNLTNCSSTDGLTCDRELAASFSNLYFQDFGDFGIPDQAIPTAVRIRVTGKAKTVYALFTGVSLGKTYDSNCQSPSDLWTMWVLNSSSCESTQLQQQSNLPLLRFLDV